MKPVRQEGELFKGALILTAAALLIKILSAIYRIPFQNIVGDVGFYIYQQVYPFYGLAVVLATTGFPVVISKIYAEYKQRNDLEGGRQFLTVSFFSLQLIGLLFFLLLYIGAGRIANLMGDAHLSVLLKVVSIVFLISPLLSVLRGYFQGNGDMIPTAVSQVAEQTIRVITILLLALLFAKEGYSLYWIGGGAMFGSITGALVSGFILFTYFKKRKSDFALPHIQWKDMYKSNIPQSILELLWQGTAICLAGMLLLFIQMADALNLFSLLIKGGMEEEAAKALKGVYDRGQPLIQLGTVLASSLSLTLVPLITLERMKEDKTFLFDKLRLAMRMNLAVGAGAAAGLWCIIRPTNIMLFENGSGSDVLGVLSLVILFNSLIVILTAIMQGLGLLYFPAVVILLGFLVKYLLNFLLIPPYETHGAAISTVLTLIFITFILRWKIKRLVPERLLSFSFIKTVLFATGVMVISLRAYLYLTGLIFPLSEFNRAGAAWQSLSAVTLGGFIFLFIMIRQSAFRFDELSKLPFGSKLIYLLPKKDRR